VGDAGEVSGYPPAEGAGGVEVPAESVWVSPEGAGGVGEAGEVSGYPPAKAGRGGIDEKYRFRGREAAGRG